MRAIWVNICALMLLLCSGSFAAFIQKPITPSSEKNFFYDQDGDGRMDAIRICFLGHLSQGYIDSAMVRLDFDWLSSKDEFKKFSIDRSKFELDESDDRCIELNLQSMQGEFAFTTELAAPAFTTNLYFADSSMIPLIMRDRMAPAVVENILKCHRDETPDTLYVRFSEKVRYRGACPAFLELWSGADSSIYVLQATSTVWTSNDMKAIMVFDSGLVDGYHLSLMDSIRAIGCTVDSVGNAASGKSPFISVYGFYPLEIYTSNLVRADGSANKENAIFQLYFESDEKVLPNKDTWGVAFDIYGFAFERAVREALMLDEQKKLKHSDFMVKLGMKIFSSSGDFIAATGINIAGDDPRFKYEPTRLFLQWNLMDYRNRKVGTGAYIAHVSAVVLYKDKVVFRDSWQNNASSISFGVMRR